MTLHALRNRSGEYWCVAGNAVDDKVNASAFLDVQCKYTVFQLRIQTEYLIERSVVEPNRTAEHGLKIGFGNRT